MLTVCWRHVSILFCSMSKPILLKTLHKVCSKSFDSTVFDMATTSRHLRREYWAFAQHCLSLFSSSFRILLFTIFTIGTSDSSLLELLFKCFISVIKDSLVKFVCSCIFRNRSINWVLFKAFKVPSVLFPKKNVRQYKLNKNCLGNIASKI